MEKLLVKLMLIAALAQFGMKLADFDNCHSRQCVKKFEKHSRDVLRVDWRPISIFPNEGKRFR